jgi:hypothetical protein
VTARAGRTESAGCRPTVIEQVYWNNWMSSLDEAGCGAGVSVSEMGGPQEENPIVGSGGGYGAIYCFAMTP